MLSDGVLRSAPDRGSKTVTRERTQPVIIKMTIRADAAANPLRTKDDINPRAWEIGKSRVPMRHRQMRAGDVVSVKRLK